jgi:hypothetical protein
MMPALIYGRMAFVDNGAATFFAATFLFAIKYLHTGKNRWLMSSVVSAGLSFLCKQLGIAATVFLFFFILAYKPESKSKLLKLILFLGIVISIYVVQISILNAPFWGTIVTSFIFTGLNSVTWIDILFLNLMPSGAAISWLGLSASFANIWGFLTVDFWYILALFVILYLIVKERETARLVLLPILSYILVLVLLGHAGAYYVIMIQPFMAIPVGYGLLKLDNMSSLFTTAFALLLCFPAATYIVYYVCYMLVPNPGGQVWVYINIDLALLFPILVGVRYYWVERTKRKLVLVMNRILLLYYVGWLIVGSFIVPIFSNAAWIVLQYILVVPIAIIGITTFWNTRMRREETIAINRFLIVLYIVCLVIGSYILPVFYPGYFAQSTVPV